MSNNIAVSITADVADLQVKRAIMSAELKAATKDLNDFAKQAASSGSTDGLREGMLASATAAEKARAGIAQVNTELKGMGAAAVPAAEHVEHGFAMISERAREMAAQVRESFESISLMRESMIGFGEVMMAAFAVEKIAEWGKEFAEQAEKVKHLGQEFGMTRQQVQGLGVEAKLTGISIDTITKGMGILDKNLFSGGQKASLFKQLGIDANTAKDQVELLAAVADKFKDMDDGPKKAALAMQLFGRAGKEMIPILDQGGEAIRAAKEKAEEYGAAYTALSDSAQAKGEALAESINETGVAWMGVTNVLGDAFGPILKEVTDSINALIKSFVDSYREGGQVAVVFQAIKMVIEEVGAVVDAVVAVFSEMWSAVTEIVGELAATIGDLFGIKIPSETKTGETYLNLFKDTMVVLKDVIIVVCEVIRGGIMLVIDYVRMFAKVAYDAVHLDWAAVDADWKIGTDRMAADVESAARRIQTAMAEAGAAISAGMKGEALPTKKTGIEAGGGGGGGFDPKMGGGGHQKKSKDELVQKLQDELDAKKLAWNLENDLHGRAIAFDLDIERKYWSDILAGTELTAKQRGEISRKYDAVEQQANKAKIATQIETFKKELDEAKGNSAARLLIAQKEAAYIGTMLGQRSKEYQTAEDQIVNIEKEGADERRRIEENLAATIDRLRQIQISEEEAEAKFRVQMGVETNAELIRDEIAAATKSWSATKAKYAQEIAAAQGNKAQIAKLTNDEAVAYAQYQTRMTALARQAALERTKIERNAITSLSSSWGQSLGKLVTLQASFGATIKSMWQGLQQAIGNALAQIIEGWLVKHISALVIGGAASKTAGLAEISTAAAIAGANGVASWALAPWPIDAGAPEFGASMAAAAGSFSAGLAAPGFAVGAWDLSKDQLAMVHSGEMIIPSAEAGGWRAVMSAIAGAGSWGLPKEFNGAPSGSRAAANSNAPFAANQGGGDIHNHHHYEAHFHGPANRREVNAWLKEHATGVAEAADHAMRRGYQPKNGGTR